MADTLDLQEAIQHVEADVARLRKLIDARAAAEAADALELGLPPEIKMPRSEAVATYLGRHPDMVSIVTDLGVALADEFKHECARIELDRYDDPEIDDHYLTFTVRLPSYDNTFMDRLDKVSRTADDALAASRGYVLITSDFQRISVP